MPHFGELNLVFLVLVEVLPGVCRAFHISLRNGLLDAEQKPIPALQARHRGQLLIRNADV